MILASLVLMAMAVQAQVTSWNGHTYEVVWYPEELVRPNDSAFGWWHGAGGGTVNGEPTPEITPHVDATARGGHVVTITTPEEETAVDLLWPDILAHGAQTSKTTMRLGMVSKDEHIVPVPGQPSIKTYTIHWVTGEVSDFPVIDEDTANYGALVRGPGSLGTHGYSGDYDNGDNGGYGWAFYILETDPPVVNPKDTDNDGLTNDEEKNTRHSYLFVQAPVEVIPNTNIGGFTLDQILADAVARGGHLLDLNSHQEHLHILDVLDPWLVRVALNYLYVTPLLKPVVYPPYTAEQGVNHLRTGDYKQHYLTIDRVQRYSTYILEIEDSTNPDDPDSDDDGLLDGQEVLTLHTNPLSVDTDGDQLLDGLEVNTTHTDPLKADTDGDGLSDYVEVATWHTNPLLGDSDGDGFDDKLEVDKGSSPVDANSQPVVVVEIFPAIEVVFPTKSGEKYQLQYTTDFKVWTNLGEIIQGTGQPVSRFVQARTEASFLRVAIVR